MSEVTRLLEAANRGDRQAAADLLPMVYDELRKLAAAKLAQEKPGHTLEATALVHEAYLRLVGDQPFANRRHFLAAAAALETPSGAGPVDQDAPHRFRRGSKEVRPIGKLLVAHQMQVRLMH